MGTMTDTANGNRTTGDQRAELVARLRREAGTLPHEVYYYLNPLLLEAADEIERLRRSSGEDVG